MSESMDKVGFSAQEKDNIFRIVAAVMHLGNITFEEELDDKKGWVSAAIIFVYDFNKANLPM